LIGRGLHARYTIVRAAEGLTNVGAVAATLPGAMNVKAAGMTVNHSSSSERAFAGDVPLVETMRGDHVESVHRGAVAVVGVSGVVLARIGDVEQPVFLRSGAKPFQVMPALLAGAVDRFGITERELAVMCASHNGEPQHIDAVRSVLSKIGLDESALRCGIHAPLSVEAAADWYRRGLEPTAACNNCSGAHVGMLMACQAAGWSPNDYGDPNHPLQRSIRAVVAEISGVDEPQLEEAMDTCAVPTFRLPLWRAALMYARLASGVGLSNSLAAAARSVRSAMTNCPDMVGGQKRFDSDVMRVAAGGLIAKGGAEGFQGVGVIPFGPGVALKISDGGEVAATTATMRALDHLELLRPDALLRLHDYLTPPILNLQGEKTGRVLAVFGLRGTG
jgi:L-asparaginase II